MSSRSYKKDTTVKSGSKDFDIMKVYTQNSQGFINGDVISGDIKYFHLIWERKEPKKMTVSETCKELGYEVEIIKED